MKKVIIILLICFSQFGWILAQRGQRSQLERFFVRPELVMKNQEVLNLTEEQRSSIMFEVQQIQSEFTSLQWDMEREMEKLKAHLRELKLDEEQILAQLDTVLELERRVKRGQMQLAVRIRNTLDEEQLRTLRRLRIRENAQQRARGREPSGTN
jgi:hypothetical protein